MDNTIVEAPKAGVFPSGFATRTAALWSPFRGLSPIVAVGGGYYVGCLAGFALRFPSSGISFFWPPTAIMTAALLLSVPRWWPALLASSLVAHAIAHAGAGVPAAASPILFLGNASQALLAAIILRRFLRGSALFASLRNVGTFLVGACALPPALASIVPAYAYVQLGWAPDFFQAWRDRAISNSIGTLTLVPSFIALSHLLSERDRTVPRRLLEYGLLLVGVIAVQLATVKISGLDVLGLSVALYAPTPFLVWATVRFGGPGLSFALVWTTLLMIDAASGGNGSLTGATPANTVVGVQLLVAANAIPMMLVAGLLEQNRTGHSALEEIQERYALATAASGVGIWELDVATRRIRIEGDLNASGGAAEAVIDDQLSSWTKLIHPDDRADIESRVASLISGRRTSMDVEFRAIRRDGATQWISGKGAVVRTSDGKPASILGTYADITERKEAARALAEANDAVIRTGRIVTVAELSASIAHEIKQPLAAIALNARACLLLLDGAAPPADFRAALNDVVHDSNRAGDIVNRTQAMFTNHPMRKTPMRLNDAVQHMLEMALARLRRSDIAVELRLDDGLPAVLADPVQVHQVLLNLIVNAIDAMSDVPQDRRVLCIGSRRARAVAIVSVGDRGHGFAPDEARRLFEPFYTTKPAGIGMGLAISRSIVTNHGGRLWGVSNVNGGSTFRFTLPLLAKTSDY